MPPPQIGDSFSSYVLRGERRKRDTESKTEETKIFFCGYVIKEKKKARCSFILFRLVIRMYIKDVVL